MSEKQLIGLDVGGTRTGIARASAVARIAQPLETVETKQVLSRLSELIDEYAVDTIVVGLPRSLDGNDTDQTRWVRQWMVGAKEKINKPFYWQDEALTTKLAELKAKTSKKTQDTDALAAAVILQDFLDTPEAERVVC